MASFEVTLLFISVSKNLLISFVPIEPCKMLMYRYHYCGVKVKCELLVDLYTALRIFKFKLKVIL